MDKIKELLNIDSLTDELSSPWVQWGSLLCAIIVIWLAIIDPYLQWRESEWLFFQQQSMRLNKLNRLSDNRAQIEAFSRDIDKKYQTAQRMLIDAKTHSRAIGQQVDAFEDVYRPHGLKFVGRRFGEPSNENWLGERVDSQWRLSGSSDDILSFLFDLSSSPRLLEAVRLEIKSGQKRRKQDAGIYEISLKVRGYRKLPLRDLKVRGRKT